MVPEPGGSPGLHDVASPSGGEKMLQIDKILNTAILNFHCKLQKISIAKILPQSEGRLCIEGVGHTTSLLQHVPKL